MHERRKRADAFCPVTGFPWLSEVCDNLLRRIPSTRNIPAHLCLDGVL